MVSWQDIRRNTKLAKLWRIILSRFKKEKEEQWIKERREACLNCQYNSLNSPHKSLKNKILKNLSDFYTWITFSNIEDRGECECGCPITLKTAEKEEECWAKVNKNDDKWKNIKIK